MALLVYTEGEQTYEFDLSLEKGMPACLSLDEEHRWHFTSDRTMQECPVQIIRADNGFYALVAAKEREVVVNDIPVPGLHVLRNADLIRIEQQDIRFYEWVRLKITSNSKLLNQLCPFCALPFAEGEHIMLCPKCDTVLHDTCWTTRQEVNEGCIVPNCGYLPPEEALYIPIRDKQKP